MVFHKRKSLQLEKKVLTLRHFYARPLQTFCAPLISLLAPGFPARARMKLSPF
jgi:hypothetical protein